MAHDTETVAGRVRTAGLGHGRTTLASMVLIKVRLPRVLLAPSYRAPRVLGKNVLDVELIADRPMNAFGLRPISQHTDTHVDARAPFSYRFELHLYRRAIRTPGLNTPAEPVDVLPVNP